MSMFGIIMPNTSRYSASLNPNPSIIGSLSPSKRVRYAAWNTLACASSGIRLLISISRRLFIWLIASAMSSSASACINPLCAGPSLTTSGFMVNILPNRFATFPLRLLSPPTSSKSFPNSSAAIKTPSSIRSLKVQYNSFPWSMMKFNSLCLLSSSIKLISLLGNMGIPFSFP